MMMSFIANQICSTPLGVMSELYIHLHAFHGILLTVYLAVNTVCISCPY